MPDIEFTDFEKSIKNIVRYAMGKNMEDAHEIDLFNAVCFAIRKYIIDLKIATEERYRVKDVKRMHYISMEFLTGPLLAANLYNLGIYDSCRDVINGMGLDFDGLIEFEPDPALGNGGLGRLAACFLDSLASMDMPGFGYGINYDYGLFRQSIVGGYQREKPDFWPNKSSPWLMRSSGEKCMIPVYGRIEDTEDMKGEYNPMWVEWKLIVGRPHDISIVGYGAETVNSLRLFSAWASDDFDIKIFNDGDYFKAVEDKIKFENISKILYPSDSQEAGKELRLVQEYFLVACSVNDIIQIYLRAHDDFTSFDKKVAIQLNDTHPALTVAELMRAFIDVHALEWDMAWSITNRTLGYTNHTLLPEALEKWPVSIVEKVIPRHLQIIREIDRRFIALLETKYPDQPEKIKKMRIIEEGNPSNIRMANLAIVGSHSVNGVAEIHSELVKQKLVPEFYQLWPERFNNKTNGVTPRRWLLGANAGLARLITDAIGDGWVKNLDKLRELEAMRNDSSFLDAFSRVKRDNKLRLAEEIKKTAYVDVDPDSMFDIQVKRIHEYKRQMLNIMHIVHKYFLIKEDGISLPTPRTFVFAGKAAPGYFIAKLIIRLIHGIAEVINGDKDVNSWLRVAFIPDYRVSLAEKIIPAADLSEQISTAGMEASGTGNMKFAINGALTIGTLDGANIEIAKEVGLENIYIFGLDVNGVEKLRKSYNVSIYLKNNPRLKRVMDAIRSDRFCPKEPGLFMELYENILNRGDYYCHAADFQSYIDTQERVGLDYMNKNDWAVKSLLNTARSGFFSSDRTVKQYAEEIWHIQRQSNK